MQLSYSAAGDLNRLRWKASVSRRCLGTVPGAMAKGMEQFLTSLQASAERRKIGKVSQRLLSIG